MNQVVLRTRGRGRPERKERGSEVSAVGFAHAGVNAAAVNRHSHAADHVQLEAPCGRGSCRGGCHLVYLAYRRGEIVEAKPRRCPLTRICALSNSAPIWTHPPWVDPSCSTGPKPRRARLSTRTASSTSGSCTPPRRKMLRRMASSPTAGPAARGRGVLHGRDQESAQSSSDYFMDSADRIHFHGGEGEAAGGGLKPEYATKGEALNRWPRAPRGRRRLPRVLRRAGRAFTAPAAAPAVAPHLRATDWRRGDGHQDSCFLYTEPRQACLGLWLALEPATLTGSCPGSARQPPRGALPRLPRNALRGRRRDGAADGLRGRAAAGKRDVGRELPEAAAAVGRLFDAGFVPVERRRRPRRLPRHPRPPVAGQLDGEEPPHLPAPFGGGRGGGRAGRATGCGTRGARASLLPKWGVCVCENIGIVSRDADAAHRAIHMGGEA